MHPTTVIDILTRYLDIPRLLRTFYHVTYASHGCYGHFITLLMHPTAATDILTRYLCIPRLLRTF